MATILKGLLSFMCEEGEGAETTGSVRAPPAERAALAAASLNWNLKGTGL